MRFSKLAATALLPAAALVSATNIVVSNDDGWAEANIRAFYNALAGVAGNSVVLSAPADNESGTGSSDATPTPRSSPCEFNSCPSGSPAYGANASSPRLNYVNSYPVTSMRYGIQNVSAKFFNGKKPDIAVAGFNVGANLGNTVLISGTVGAATEAAKEGVPALAFSGSTGSQISYTTSPMPNYVGVYAALSRNVTQALIAAGTPYLPNNTWLNVNFPVSNSTQCTKVSDFKFVLSRIALSQSSKEARSQDLRRRAPDVKCSGALPAETDVVNHAGCYASISVGVATTKADADSATQQVVQKKLNSILSCLPS